MCVSTMRTEAGRDPDARALQELVGELLADEELAIAAEPGLVLLAFTAEPAQRPPKASSCSLPGRHQRAQTAER